MQKFTFLSLSSPLLIINQLFPSISTSSLFALIYTAYFRMAPVLLVPITTTLNSNNPLAYFVLLSSYFYSLWLTCTRSVYCQFLIAILICSLPLTDHVFPGLFMHLQLCPFSSSETSQIHSFSFTILPFQSPTVTTFLTCEIETLQIHLSRTSTSAPCSCFTYYMHNHNIVYSAISNTVILKVAALRQAHCLLKGEFRLNIMFWFISLFTNIYF